MFVGWVTVLMLGLVVVCVLQKGDCGGESDAEEGAC